MLPNTSCHLRNSMEPTGKIGPTQFRAHSDSPIFSELPKANKYAPNQLLPPPQRLRYVLLMIGIDETMKGWDSYNLPSKQLFARQSRRMRHLLKTGRDSRTHMELIQVSIFGLTLLNISTLPSPLTSL